jgi:hypothetical protein
LRDVVTAARLLASPHPSHPDSQRGELRDHFGLFYLVRTVSALGGKRVLNVIRGLRRGEVRFYEGEITSAQVGGLHGQAAFYQLMLWEDARFELRHEPVVRRQQIPLRPDELLAEAERFLSEISSVGGDLRPAAIYQRALEASEQDRADLPPEVLEILHLFDGSRCLVDVIEDSPYRTFETLRIARRLAELGMIKVGGNERSHLRERTPLHIDEWRVNGSASAIGPSVRARGKSQPRPTATVITGKTAEDWGPLLPAHGQVDLEGFTQVVPSAATAGEIDLAGPSRNRTPTAPTVHVVDAHGGPPEEPRLLALADSQVRESDTVPLRRRSERTVAATDPTPSPVVGDPVLLKTEGLGAPAAASASGMIRVGGEPFSEDEEAFFKRGSDLIPKPAASPESFEDLDEGYELPRTFWQRFFRDPNAPLERSPKGQAPRPKPKPGDSEKK